MLSLIVNRMSQLPLTSTDQMSYLNFTSFDKGFNKNRSLVSSLPLLKSRAGEFKKGPASKRCQSCLGRGPISDDLRTAAER